MSNVVMIAAPLCTGVSSFGPGVAARLTNFTGKSWLFFDYEWCFPKALRAECSLQSGLRANSREFTLAFDSRGQTGYIEAVKKIAEQGISILAISPFEDLLALHCLCAHDRPLAQHETVVAYEFVSKRFIAHNFFAVSAVLCPSKDLRAGRENDSPNTSRTILTCEGMIEVEVEFSRRIAEVYALHPFHYGEKVSTPQTYTLAAQRALIAAETYKFPVVRATVRDTVTEVGHKVFETIRLNYKALQC